ncbi:MAG: four helix bundle protein [Vicingaceae bacterium]
MHKVKELKVWHKGMEIVEELYALVKDFPIEEKYGLTSQMKRAAISIPSNIAEGAGRRSPAEFRHFLNISNGSSYELDTQLLLAKQLGFLTGNEIDQLLQKIEELQKMNYALINKLK